MCGGTKLKNPKCRKFSSKKWELYTTQSNVVWYKFTLKKVDLSNVEWIVVFFPSFGSIPKEKNHVKWNKLRDCLTCSKLISDEEKIKYVGNNLVLIYIPKFMEFEIIT